MPRKFSKETGKYVEKAMKEFEAGKFQSRQQAIAVGLSEARAHGEKVPKKKG